MARLLRRRTAHPRARTTKAVAVLCATLAAGLLANTAALASPASAQASAAAVDRESSITLDWYTDERPYLPAGFSRVDESRLTAPLPNWLDLRGYQLSIDHYTTYPWNAPSTFDVPYIWNEPYGPDQTGVMHVTMSRMPSPPPVEWTQLAPGIVLDENLPGMFAKQNYWFQGLTALPSVLTDVDGLRETREWKPLNAEMAKYFTYNVPSDGYMRLQARKDAPPLPDKYWTLDWFAIDYHTSANLADPSRADMYSSFNGGIHAEADRQLRFTKPKVAMGLPSEFGTFYISRGAISHGKKYDERRIVVSPSTFSNLDGVVPSSVRIKILKTSPIFKDFRLRRPHGEFRDDHDTIRVVERKGHKIPKSTSFQYQLTARDYEGLLVKSDIATITFDPDKGRPGVRLR